MTDQRASQISIDEYGNKHYYQAEEEFTLNVESFVSLEFDQFQFNDLKDSINIVERIKNANIEIDRIEDLRINEIY